MQQMVSLSQILLLAQHVSGTIMPIVRSSGVLYRGLLPVVFGAMVFKLSVWCRAVGYVSGLQDAAESRKPDTQPTALHQTGNLKPKHQIPQAATTCIILLSS